MSENYRNVKIDIIIILSQVTCSRHDMAENKLLIVFQ